MRVLPILLAALALASTVHAALVEPAVDRFPLRLEPADPQIATLPTFPARWFLPSDTANNFGDVLAKGNFDASLAAELAGRLQLSPDTGDGIIIPDRDLLAEFKPDELHRWHDLLASLRGNPTYRWPLSLSPHTLAALAAQPRWAEAVRRLRALGFAHGDRLILGHLFALEDAFANPRDRQEFYQVALGADVFALTLHRDPTTTADTLQEARWWQVNGRYRAIEPMLNALDALPSGEPPIDVTHLLPRLPRSLLYTYPPDLADSSDPGAESSLLASDFFSFVPGADADAPGAFAAWLDAQCVPVTDDSPHYGDLLVYGDLAHTPWPYTAVYIVGGTALARRPTLLGPWQLLDLADIGRLNPRFASTQPRVYRLRHALPAPGEPPFDPGRMPEVWRRQVKFTQLASGPWGRLWCYDVLLAPPSDALARLPAPSADPVWTFKDTTRQALLDAVDHTVTAKATHDSLHTLFAAATPDSEGRLTVHPDLTLVLATPAEFRAATFAHLVGSTALEDYAQTIAFPTGFAADEWFDDGSLPAAVRKVARRLAYPVGDQLKLSDFGALYHVFETPRERLTTLRAALRAPGLVVMLERPRPDELPGLIDYWRHLGRVKSTERLLTSFAAQDQSRFLDIVHLLSPFEREYLDTYFTATEPGLVPSCFWTAFNFGEDRPDPRFLVIPGATSDTAAQVWHELETRFDRVTGAPRLGDLIAYHRAGVAEVEHICAYVAADLVFTKNGYAISAPWCLARLSDIDTQYPAMERLTFRRRPAADPTTPPPSPPSP